MIVELLDDDIRLTAPDMGQPNKNPYPGTRAYEFSEASLFFGQDHLCDQVLSKIRENRFVCILGGAGVGKTSLINGGVKPALFGGLFEGLQPSWHIFHLQPGNSPILNMARCISKSKKVEFFEEDQHLKEQICCQILKRGRNGLIELISQLLSAENEEFLFIIDQFEEIFRLRNTGEQSTYNEEAFQYVDLLLEALKNKNVKVQVVISIRSDFTDDCVFFPALAELINKSNVIVPKMDREQIKNAILGPLNIYKIQVEDMLLARLLNDTSITDDALPRLQFALHQTWNNWIVQNNWHKPISLKDYESTGGISNAISIYADSIYNSLDDADKHLCEIIFKSLTERGAENKGFTRPVSVKDLSLIGRAEIEDIWRVINAFHNSTLKLLHLHNEDNKSECVVNLVHVSLIRTWDRLKLWVEDEAISGQMYKQLSDSAAAYLVGKTGLLKPPDLNFALNWKEKQKPNVHWAQRYSPAFERVIVYLSTSYENHKAEEELKRLKDAKSQKKVRSLFLVLGATLFIALVLTILSQLSKNSSERQKNLALEQKQEAMEKSLKAEQLSKEALEEKTKAENAANEAEQSKQKIQEESKLLTEQKLNAESAAQQAVQRSNMSEQNLKQLSIQNQEIEKNAYQVTQQKNAAENEAEASYQMRMITLAQTLAIKSIQVENNNQLKALLSVYANYFNSKYNGPNVQSDIFSALLLTAAELRIPYRLPLPAHIGAVNGMCSNDRSNMMYSTGSDGKIYAWNISTPSPSARLIANLKTRNLSIAISPNGKLLAVGSDLGNIKIIDLAGYDVVADLKGHSGAVFSMSFSKDGLQLFSTASDKKILLWDMDNHSSKEIYSGTSSVRSISLSPDGRFLAGGTENGHIYIWDIKTNQMSEIQTEQHSAFFSLDFNPSGTLLASGDLKGNVQLWNPYSHKLIRTLKSHNARVVDVKFSAIGDYLVSSSYDGSAYIFDTKTAGLTPLIIREPGAYVMGAVINSNNQRIFIATNKSENLISYPCQSNTLVNAICPKISRNLTTEEWNAYIGSDIKFVKPCE
jgi:WD40 repeat protein